MPRTTYIIGSALALSLAVLLAGCNNTPVSNLTPQAGTTNVAQASTPAAAATTQAGAASPATSPTSGAATISTLIPTPTPSPMPSLTPTLVTGSNCDHTAGDIGQGGAPFATPEVISSQNGQLRTELVATFTDPAKVSIAGCGVNLRTYNGNLVGPMLRARPGDTLYITLTNNLTDTFIPEVPTPTIDHSAAGGMHDGDVYNITNLHTHGLHVSPKPGSDDVLLELKPGQSIPIQIKIPSDHQPGTFWYHSHLHGATAVQVSSGMEGALIIEGDIDQVPAIKAAKEQTLLIQQVYFDQQGMITATQEFGPGNWEQYNRQYTINGQLFPKLSMYPGEVQRWRLIQGGVRETTCLAMVGPTSLSPTTAKLEDIVGLSPNMLHEIAVDGISLGSMDDWTTLELEPGYRSDVLVQPSGPGWYYLLDLGNDPSGKVNCNLRGDSPETPKMLASIEVSGTGPAMALPSAAELAQLQRPPDIADSEIRATQVVSFCVCSVTNTVAITPTAVATPAPSIVFTVNGRSFSEEYSRTLTLGTADEWQLSVDPASLAPAHPFHIHVNPFQVCRTGPDGNGELVWKDTVLVQLPSTTMYTFTSALTKTYTFTTNAAGQLGCAAGPPKAENPPLLIRTRYQDFDGQYVLHCHILDHEDQGMMELENLVAPQSSATPTPAALRPDDTADGGTTGTSPAQAGGAQQSHPHGGHGATN